jgi:bifunctional non-homologous end joining protein LigD
MASAISMRLILTRGSDSIVDVARPPTLSPMLIGVVGLPTDAANRLIEPKWDGVRVIATVTGGRARLASRNGRDATDAYPELQPPPESIDEAVLDGEVVAIDATDRPNFGLLQRRMHVRRPSALLVAEVPVTFVAFDLLWIDGELLIDEPLVERRRRLDALDIGRPPWMTSPVLDLPGGSEETLRAAGRELGLEGFVLKRRDSPYLPGRRSAAWAKLKVLRRREFVVGGWLEGRAGQVGSLALGVWEPEPRRLRFVGMVGSGLRQTGGAAFREAASALERADSPFAGPTARGVRFLEPVLVAEVTFSEVTEGGTLRQPVLIGFRTDKDPDDVMADYELR